MSEHGNTSAKDKARPMQQQTRARSDMAVHAGLSAGSGCGERVILGVADGSIGELCGKASKGCIVLRGVLGIAAAVVIGASMGGCLEASKRQAAAESGSILAAFTPMSPAEAARDMVDPFNPDKRFRGMTLISAAPFGGEDVYVNIYRDAIANDSDEGVRAVAARALSIHGAPGDVEKILPLAKSEDRRVRLVAVRALQRLHNPVAIEPLLTRLDAKQETDRDVREAAATALGQYADPRVVDALIAEIDDDDLAVVDSSRESLKTLTGADEGMSIKGWRTWRQRSADLFAGRKAYVYPAFSRDPFWFEYLPLVSPPPNEVAASPVGMQER
jgi:hypothetical protein